MANNVRQGFGNSPLDVYLSFPPVTRTLVTTFAATALVTSLGFVDGRLLLLSWPAIFSRYFQVWRLVTSFLFLGPFSLYWLITSLWTIQYGKAVEQGVFRGDSAEYLFMLLFGGSSLLVVSLLLKPFLRINLLAPALVFMLVYIWSRNFPTANVSLFGLFTVEGRYLPWCLIIINIAMGGNWVNDVLGVFVGHLYYFLTVVHPQATGSHLLQTPNWLRRLMLQYRIGTVPVATVQMHNPADPGFRAFRGQGRRLNG